MIRAWIFTSCVATVVILFACIPVRAADASPEDVIKAKGLVKSGALYLTEGDSKLPESLKAFRVVKKQMDDDSKKRADLEGKVRMAKGAIGGWEQEYRSLNEKLATAKDAFTNNQIVGKINALVSKIKEGTEYVNQQEGELAKLGNTRDAYVGAVLELGEKFDAIAKEYEALGADTDVKGALDKLNEKARPKMKLGPSVDYTQNAALIKKQRETIKSDVIAITLQGHVPHVDVNLNGKLMRSLVLDSGASMVCLTSDLAKMLDMVPGPENEVMKMQLADGKVVDARRMVLKSVRVGSFTVENVDCAVLPPDLVAADNLLGGSFLRNFVYKLDPQAGELHLSQIGGKATPASPAATDKKPAAPADPKPPGGNPLDKKPAGNPLDNGK